MPENCDICEEPAVLEDDGVLLCVECLRRLNAHKRRYPEKFLP